MNEKIECRSLREDICYDVVSQEAASFLYSAIPKTKLRYTKKSNRVNSAGSAAYVERNCLMIKDSNFVVVHLEEGRNDGKSGSRLAYKYSLRQKKCMITV